MEAMLSVLWQKIIGTGTTFLQTFYHTVFCIISCTLNVLFTLYLVTKFVLICYRKRSREDDTCEFMPLSKRINNLHINNNLGNGSNAHMPESSHVNGINTDNGISSPSSSSDSERRPSYDPGINSSQSSYYYDNKLLFELHLERVQRTGQQFPF